MRIAVLGLGFMGGTHVRAIQRIQGLELAAVYSRDPERRIGGCTGVRGNISGLDEEIDAGSAELYTDLIALLANPSIDAVDICLPTFLHEQVAGLALEHGKHVLVEKPIGLNVSSIERLIDKARDHKLILMAAHVLRFFPEYALLPSAVAGGAVYSAFFRRVCAAPQWSPWLTELNKSGGALFDLLIHDADMCLNLFGQPEAVSAHGSIALETGVDVVTAQLRYPDIPSVTISGGWHHPAALPFRMEYTIAGSSGTYEYRSGALPPTRYTPEGTSELLALTGGDGYQAEIAYFAECCCENRWPILCPPEQSLAAVRLMYSIAESRSRKGEWISCRS